MPRDGAARRDEHPRRAARLLRDRPGAVGTQGGRKSWAGHTAPVSRVAEAPLHGMLKGRFGVVRVLDVAAPYNGRPSPRAFPALLPPARGGSGTAASPAPAGGLAHFF
ncbi:hypothetical protein [Streptomyces pratensis]|uniref:hypothetical protein n=1 Tax=Streptomyces pratensis TaxID=1169025 RepID=UPI0036344261